MKRKKNDIYVLGTGLSHDGSACLLKNGEICVAIEKERITRRKHEGGNDTDSINYCLDAEGIVLSDIDLVVQNGLDCSFEHDNSFYLGPRLFNQSTDIPIYTISHHLAHAYYALGTCQYEETSILVQDGFASSYDECIDLKGSIIYPKQIPDDIKHIYHEKDSFYLYKNKEFKTILKDFSPSTRYKENSPMNIAPTKHSIGSLYATVAAYCFENQFDTGKLMGLSPYGRPNIYKGEIFELSDGRVFVNHDTMRKFNLPARSAKGFWDNFQYYADIAFWVQRETERAITYLLKCRRDLVTTENLCFTGGVALNAVANGKILKEEIFKNIYFTPAAGDNGLSIGCAYYGWLEILKRERIFHNGNSCFGKIYAPGIIKREIENFVFNEKETNDAILELYFQNIGDFIDGTLALKKNYLISFVFSDQGVYNISYNYDKLSFSNVNSRAPDCLIVTDVKTFIKSSVDRNVFFESINEKKTILIGDIAYFLKTTKNDQLAELIKNLSHKSIKIKKINYSEEKDIFKKGAELLADGKIIAWFQDGCEFGPRALGNRSILADPRQSGVQKFINNRIKFREDFRPFAPVVLKEDIGKYFEHLLDSPYMIITAEVKEKWRNIISGVTHVDNSARIQTVTLNDNEKLYKLIKEFKALTGLPILLNTSFNTKGMPIVETPSQALSFFFECDLDCLIIDKFIITKDLNPVS